MLKQTYSFTLVLSGVRQDTPNLEDALFNAGCDDALIVYKNNYVMLDFDRESSTLSAAINSAIKQIEGSGIGARVDHIEGEYATLSELAKITGFTKQAISLFVQGKRGEGDFPVPAFGLSYQSPIWKVSDVCEWFIWKKSANNDIQKYTCLKNKYELIHRINDHLKGRFIKKYSSNQNNHTR